MKITQLLGVGILAAGLAIATNTSPTQAADHHRSSVNSRQQRQHQRIVNGKRGDELTRREALRLRQRQAAIRQQELRDRRDGGTYTSAERLRTQRRLNRSSRSIYRQKHDRQDR